jgi:hypothetical protein
MKHNILKYKTRQYTRPCGKIQTQVDAGRELGIIRPEEFAKEFTANIERIKV